MIKAKNISIGFESLEVISELNFQVSKGEKVAIIGESGTGKSSLLNALAGFVPIKKGELNLFDLTVNGVNIDAIRNQLSWLPQETSLHFETVHEMLYSAFDLESNLKNKPEESQVSSMFKQLNLSTDVLQKTPSTISGGQKQRVLLASSLLLQKPLLIMDEPTSALDESNRKRITDYIMSQNDLTVIAATHDSYWIEKSTRIIRL